ncbi:MAG TPA: hypothetical protein VGS22_01145 [Thermoanaerobaculia bacterium]|jgi:hypothetical protein|nr:hypothetical protein [Thermoanaerobaculia bacterium]
MSHRNRRFAAFGLLVLVLAAFALPATAGYRGRWILLGERSVTDGIDHDTIVVTGARGRFEKIAIRVFDRAVQFHDVKVHYGDGFVQDVEIRSVIPAAGWSRIIDLSGGRRVIRSIEFWYDAQSLGGKATVRVFGQH